MDTKFEASIARFTAHTLALEAKRRRLVQIAEPPKPQESAHSEKKPKTRAVPHASCRCRAKTLEGKQCGFKSTCGDFCKKHSIKTSQ